MARTGGQHHQNIHYTRLLAIVPIEYKLNFINMDRTELFKIIEWLVDNNHVKLLTPGINILDHIDSLNNSMSEGERQPVGNNEQGVSKCIPLFHNSAIKYYGQCSKCGQATEM